MHLIEILEELDHFVPLKNVVFAFSPQQEMSIKTIFISGTSVVE